MRSLGVDVSARRGLDLVLLDHDRRILDRRRRVGVDEVAEIAAASRADVVAIDAPPAWASSGRSRVGERDLARTGLRCFNTPSDTRMAEHPFYEWMTVGFRVFAAIAGRFPRYRGGRDVSGTAIEVFPHATAAALAGRLPPPGTRKGEWRRRILAQRGVDASALGSLDQVDAALAALTGLFALEDFYTALGDSVEGQIVVPASVLPPDGYRRRRPLRRAAERGSQPR